MITKNLPNNFFINLSVILFIFLFDRITKLYVIYLYKQNLNSEIFTSKFLNIYLVWNEGIAFGFFSFNQDYLYNILTLIISIVVLVILYFIFKSDGLKKYALIMIFGGAIGNLFDRVVYGAVADFIDFHVGNFHWFIFNVSDIFITLGVIILMYLEFFSSKQNV